MSQIEDLLDVGVDFGELRRQCIVAYVESVSHAHDHKMSKHQVKQHGRLTVCIPAMRVGQQSTRLQDVVWRIGGSSGGCSTAEDPMRVEAIHPWTLSLTALFRLVYRCQTGDGRMAAGGGWLVRLREDLRVVMVGG